MKRWLFSINTTLNIGLLYLIIVLFLTVTSIIVLFLAFLDFNQFHQTSDILLLFIVPIMIYDNADTDKSIILSDNKGKAGIYLWTHKLSGKKYIGSAIDLSKRIKYYFNTSELKRVDNYICRAIISHTHSAFSLSILDHIDTSNLNMKDARILIL